MASQNIFDAIDENNLELVKRLIEHDGVDINIREDDGKTPLIYACCNDDCEEIAKYLVEHGADVNARDDHGTTALMPASYSNLDMVKYLVEHGAYVNATTRTGFTARQHAKVEHQDDIVKYLDENGANDRQPKSDFEYLLECYVRDRYKK
jgi:ankyrin repeat protein